MCRYRVQMRRWPESTFSTSDRCGTTLFQSSHDWAHNTLFNLVCDMWHVSRTWIALSQTKVTSFVTLSLYTYYANWEIGMHTIHKGKGLYVAQKLGNAICMSTHELWAHPNCKLLRIWDRVASWKTGDLTCRRNLHLLGWWDGMGWDMWRCCKWWAHL
jgi:hypothetical protein